MCTSLGEALGALHNLPYNNAGFGDRGAPWPLSLGCPDLAILYQVSAASIELLKIVQHSPDLSRALAALGDQWGRHSLVHFDIRLDNCLATPNAELRIVDWELIGAGDPCWDTGSFFADFLSCWVLSMPITQHTKLDRLPYLAARRLTTFQPGIRAFWRSYVRSIGVSAAEAEKRLLRSVRYAAARLVQAAFEWTQDSAQPSAHMMVALQLSQNILKRPEEAVVRLLGISGDSRESVCPSD